ncbi:anti-sigma factor family protein [Moorella sp. Hama-1]|uniref:anti-sigma factor family protein n=1 Tax=Moorella sp. Hama-1 TaxID=2138101 RepID=UPI000D6530A0|nr:zf-HC2 domain-containing protein [Moorella sp. Hama-1]BCV21022.1 transcriptional regulator, anti-sigma factor [Moorella sp. Hama-1]
MCPEEGLLEAFLDGELDTEMTARVAGHLAGCLACRRRLQDLEGLAKGTSEALAAYRRDIEAAGRPLRAPGPGSLASRYQPLTKARRIGDMIRQHKWFSGVAAAVLALALFLSWAPGRSLAAQFLNVFRMEKIQVVKITPEDMAQLEQLFQGQGGEVDIKNIGRVEVKDKAEFKVKQVEPDQVAALSGLQFDLPPTLAGRERMAINVEQSPTVTFTPDVEKLNSYLQKHGGVLLPADLAGKSFTLSIPPLVRADYGRRPFQPGQGFTIYAARDLTIDAPQGVDLVTLRQALLNLPFLPENLRRQLAAINDWQRTLPIPETQGMAAREITVNGNQGVYFTSTTPTNYPNGKVQDSVILAWRQGNGWRAISGLSLDEALRVAAEVK